MSDEEEDYAFYGDPLEPLDDDSYRKQKAPKLEDQVVTDKEGRQRFHGAFTGGFSAGYFNTVGSKQGWTPSTFSSSRINRAEKVPLSTAVDFMDDEDLEAHGIAPQGIKTRNDFEIHDGPKRKRLPEVEGPIPGDAVLSDLLVPIRETIGMKVLKKFGWKHGQGIGPRLCGKSKRENLKENRRLYGCQLPPANDARINSSSDEDEPEVTFAPSDQNVLQLDSEKDNFFGLGYRPMTRPSIFGSVSNPLRLTDGQKKVSIAGRAFGVGAFEDDDDDDDIYAKENLSNYDFSLGPSTSPSKTKRPFHGMDRIADQLEGFVISSSKANPAKIAKLPVLPPNFVPRHAPIKRRFNLEEKDIKGLGRHELSAEDRGRILSSSEVTSEIRTGVAVSEEAVKAKADAQLMIATLLEEQRSGVGKNFQPYSKDAEKQKRYELYCKMKEKGMNDRYHLVQPKNMTEWEKEREQSEFERSHSLFKPLVSSMAARFTKSSTEGNLQTTSESTGKINELKVLVESDVRRNAARNKMFGKQTLIRVNWHPDPVVCKRFFVTNPYSGSTTVGVPGAKHDKVSIFNFLEAPVEETAGLQISSDSKGTNASLNDLKLEGSKTKSVSIEEDLPAKSDEPPTIDLFKAIFQDSDTDSDQSDEPELIKVKDSPERINPISFTKSNEDNMDISSELSNRIPDKTSISNSQSLARMLYKNPDSSEKADSSNRIQKQPTFIPFKMATTAGKKDRPEVTSSQSAKTAKGIFSNIDFQALNEYRSTSVTPANPTPVPSQSTDSEQEYGPVPPSAVNQRLPYSPKDDVGRSKSKKQKKKSKHKKHKKEKKRHKHKS